MNIKLTKNLKFRLAILYSAILFIFSAIIILIFNIYINAYLATGNKTGPPPPPPENNTLLSEQQDQGAEESKKRISEERFANLKNIQTISFISLIPLALISFALGYFLSGRFLFPLEVLNRQIEKLKTDNLGMQIEKKSDDEIGQLVKSFNNMSRRLKNSFDAQNEFVQDAAHEIKTPLTIIQTNLETVLARNGTTIDDYKKAANRSLDGIDKLNSLTENLLTLAAPSAKDKQKIDFISVVKEQIYSLQNFAEINKVKILLDFSLKEIMVKANEFLLSRAIYNIIENAIKFSSSDNNPEVKISVESNNNMVQLTTKNNGSLVPASEKDKIFDRFYRIDKSRDSKVGGYGLGLSIVKKIIDENQGTITVSSDDKYTSFVIKLKKV